MRKIIIESNSLYGTKEIKSYFDKVKKESRSINEIMNLLLPLISKEADITFKNFIYPTRLDSKEKWNRRYVGFMGDFTGNIDCSRVSGELYGGNLFKDCFYCEDEIKINNIDYFYLTLGKSESCSGGGGSNFKYLNEYIILLDEYETIKKMNIDILSKGKVLELQSLLDTKVDEERKLLNDIIKSIHLEEISKDPEISSIDREINDLLVKLESAKNKKKNLESKLLVDIKEREYYEIKIPEISILNLQKVRAFNEDFKSKRKEEKDWMKMISEKDAEYMKTLSAYLI